MHNNHFSRIMEGAVHAVHLHSRKKYHGRKRQFKLFYMTTWCDY